MLCNMIKQFIQSNTTYINIYTHVVFDVINYFIISRSCLYLLSPYSHEDGDSSYPCIVGTHLPKIQPYIPQISDLNMVCIWSFSKWCS